VAKLGRKPKTTAAQREEIASRYGEGESCTALAKEFGIVAGSVLGYAHQRGIYRERVVCNTDPIVLKFARRVRSVLWRQDGRDKKTYNAWASIVRELTDPDGIAMNRNIAIVKAAKEFPCVHKLFKEFNVADYDNDPKSHPEIEHFGGADPDMTDPSGGNKVRSDNKKQSYRENLAWAMASAGEFMRTGETPAACPNDSAWYLYIQACKSPKDFCQRVAQVESKGSEENAGEVASARRSISELDAMLEELEEEDQYGKGANLEAEDQ